VAPKVKKDLAWDHCYWFGGNQGSQWVRYTRAKQHLANERGKLNLFENLPQIRAEIQGYLDAYKQKQIQKEIQRGSSLLDVKNPSFEESLSFPVVDPFRVPLIPPREEVVFGTSNSKRTSLDSFFIPCTTPSAHPTIDSKWRKMETNIA
jgi:hypothetical protein